MKMKSFCLFVSLLLVSGVSAQVPDSLKAKQSVQTVTLSHKTDLEILTEKAKKLKITPQNLVDVKEAVKPMLQTAGIPTDAKDVLVFVDGKEVPLETYKTMNPGDIDSITVLKNQEAIKKLTAKKCTSVILIKTKKKTTN
jgi:hypothetical protein